MKLFIPKIGTKVTLSKPWTFSLSDESRNEKFWLSLHGKPNKIPYYYGYTGGFHTSPTPTASATQLGHESALPKLTTLPVGTQLFVESFHIQKGHTPRICLRIKKENPTRIACGKFLVSLEDINKMEIDAEFSEKYPRGQFVIRVASGVDRNKCKCRYDCNCGAPEFTEQVMTWESDPDTSCHSQFKVGKIQKTDTAGLNVINDGGFSWYNRGTYTKSFDNIQDFLLLASKKGFTKELIDTFIKEYEPKRVSWEQSKA